MKDTCCMDQNHVFSLLRNTILHLRHKTLHSMFLALSFFFCLTAKVILILLKNMALLLFPKHCSELFLSRLSQGFSRPILYRASLLTRDERMRAAGTIPVFFKRNWVQMMMPWLWSVANRTCLKPPATASLLAVPVVRSGWIKWEGKQRLKDSIIYTFFSVLPSVQTDLFLPWEI